MAENTENTIIYWHWDTVEKRIYTRKQWEALSDETIKARCVDVPRSEWLSLVDHPVAGKHIDTDPETGKPIYIDDPPPTEEDLLRREKEEKQRYLEETNTETILYLQQIMTPMPMTNGETSTPVMTAEEYSEMNTRRLQYAERIKEIETILAG